MMPLLPQTCLAISRNPSKIILRNLIRTPSVTHGGLAPKLYSSNTGDTAKMVSRLSTPRVTSIIMTGKPNRPLPSEFQVDLDEFIPVSVSAAGLVTSCLSSGDWKGLEGVMDKECIASLQAIRNTTGKEKVEYQWVKPADVFISFVSNPGDCDSGNTLHLVTFSLPQLEQVRTMLTGMFKTAVAAGPQGLKQKILGSKTILKDNNIVIGNYKFVRDTPAGEWFITEVAQVSSMQAWYMPERYAWKVLLGQATVGSIITKMEFRTFLRFFLVYICFASIVSFSLNLFILSQLLAGDLPSLF